MLYRSREEIIVNAIEVLPSVLDMVSSEASIDLSGIEVFDARALFVENYDEFYDDEYYRSLESFDMDLKSYNKYVQDFCELESDATNKMGLYDTNVIYLNTSSYARALFRDGLQFVDRILVHELGHGVWEKLSGRDTEQLRADYQGDPRALMIEEGFCEHMEDVRVTDKIHSRPIQKKDYSGLEVYEAGALRIAQMIEVHGDSVYYEIPKNWLEIDKATPMTQSEYRLQTTDMLDLFDGEVLKN